MHTLTLKRVLGFTIVILLLLALFIWGIGLETLKARQVDLLYLGQRHLMLVFTSMFFALLVGIPSGILLSRPAAKGFAEYVMQIFNVGNTLPPLAVLALAMVIIGIGDTPAILTRSRCSANAPSRKISPPSRKWWQKSNKSGRTILTTTGCSVSIWNLPGAATG